MIQFDFSTLSAGILALAADGVTFIEADIAWDTLNHFRVFAFEQYWAPKVKINLRQSFVTDMSQTSFNIWINMAELVTQLIKQNIFVLSRSI